MKIRTIALLLAGMLSVLPAVAQKAADQVGSLAPYKVYQGHEDPHEPNTYIGARFCFIYGKAEHCIKNDDVKDVEVKEVNLKSGRRLLLFYAYSFWGNGGDYSVSLLDEQNQQPVNLLPSVGLTGPGTVKTWELDSVSPLPVLVTSDMIWADKESHIDPHAQEIAVYIYNPASGKYERSFKYATAKKYTETKNVLTIEKPRILAKLAATVRGSAPSTVKSHSASHPTKSVSSNAAPLPAQGPKPKYGLLDDAAIQSYLSPTEYTGEQFDLLLMSMMPSLFDSNEFMRYFVVLNNCRSNPFVLQKIDNEFEYPSLAAYYRENMSQILSTIRASKTLHSFSVKVGPYKLGEYNTTRHSFPFVEGESAKQVTISEIGLRHAIRPRVLHCALNKKSLIYTYDSKLLYSVGFDELRFNEFPMDEASARSYVSSLGVNSRDRTVYLQIDFDIVESIPEITIIDYNMVKFKGHVNKVTVVNAGTQRAQSGRDNAPDARNLETSLPLGELSVQLGQISSQRHHEEIPPNSLQVNEIALVDPGSDKAYTLESEHLSSKKGDNSGEKKLIVPGERSPIRFSSEEWPERKPSFIVQLHMGESPDTVSFYRHNPVQGRREVILTGKGKNALVKDGSNSEAIQFDAQNVQSTIYTLMPQKPLSPGEYCLGVQYYEVYCFGIDAQ